MNNDKYDKDFEEDENDEEDEEKNTDTKKSSLFFKFIKFLVIALILGLILVLVILAIGWVMNKMKEKKDKNIENTTSVPSSEINFVQTDTKTGTIPNSVISIEPESKIENKDIVEIPGLSFNAVPSVTPSVSVVEPSPSITPTPVPTPTNVPTTSNTTALVSVVEPTPIVSPIVSPIVTPTNVPTTSNTTASVSVVEPTPSPSVSPSVTPTPVPALISLPVSEEVKPVLLSSGISVIPVNMSKISPIDPITTKIASLDTFKSELFDEENKTKNYIVPFLKDKNLNETLINEITTKLESSRAMFQSIFIVFDQSKILKEIKHYDMIYYGTHFPYPSYKSKNFIRYNDLSPEGINYNMWFIASVNTNRYGTFTLESKYGIYNIKFNNYDPFVDNNNNNEVFDNINKYFIRKSDGIKYIDNTDSGAIVLRLAERNDFKPVEWWPVDL